MRKKPLVQLPCLTLTPTARSQGSFEPCDVMPDPDEDSQLYLTIYGMGMDVQVSLDVTQAKLIRDRLTEALAETVSGSRT